MVFGPWSHFFFALLGPLHWPWSSVYDPWMLSLPLIFSLALDPWPLNLDLPVLSYPILSYLVLWRLLLFCFVFLWSFFSCLFSCLVMFCLVSCLVVSCLGLSCIVLSWLGLALACPVIALSYLVYQFVRKYGHKRIQGGNDQGSGIRAKGHTRSQRGNAEWRKTGENVVLYCSRISIWWLARGCLALPCLVLSYPVIVLWWGCLATVFLLLLYCLVIVFSVSCDCLVFLSWGDMSCLIFSWLSYECRWWLRLKMCPSSSWATSKLAMHILGMPWLNNSGPEVSLWYERRNST